MISTHTGPLCQFAAGMSTTLALSDELVAAGFKRPLIGKVAISSFMGEWGYLLTTKESELVVSELSKEGGEGTVVLRPDALATHLPADAHVLDEQAIQSFYLIPKYYFKGCTI